MSSIMACWVQSRSPPNCLTARWIMGHYERVWGQQWLWWRWVSFTICWDPFISPPNKNRQLIYISFSRFLYNFQFHWLSGSFYNLNYSCLNSMVWRFSLELPSISGGRGGRFSGAWCWTPNWGGGDPGGIGSWTQNLPSIDWGSFSIIPYSG